MRQDLQWYILHPFRKKGYLTKALKEVIFPYLFQQREEQKITINPLYLTDNEFAASQSVARNLGFEPIGAHEYLLTGTAYKPIRFNATKPMGISDERMLVLQNRLNYLSRSLWTIQTEIATSLGHSVYVEKVEALVNELRKQVVRLENASWEFKNNKS